MKTKQTKTTSIHYPSRRQAGFTLIEMIGVLAVIAILASLLIPKIFSAIDSSRAGNASMSCNTVKAAVADHYSKFGTLMSDNGAPIAAAALPFQTFDKSLVTEAFLD